MNYFRVQAVGLVGWQGIPVEVECVQSRRLPFLQILGASAGAAAEMRERVIAAVESAGVRMPARRITARFLPGTSGFSLENLDLALALAILAASGKIPPPRLENILVSGSLGLDGSIRAQGAEFATRKLFANGSSRGAILPWEESSWLPVSALSHGGGFRTLAEVISFLSGREIGKIGVPAVDAGQFIGENTAWAGESSARCLEIAAAGGHHALFLAPESAAAENLAALLGQILARVEQPDNEKELWANLRGKMFGSPAAPLKISAESGAGHTFPKLHAQEELFLAKNGVVFLDRITELEAKTLVPVFRWMESGRLRWTRATHSFAETLEANVLATVRPCECGRNFGRCRCQPLELQKYRRRLEKAVMGPFDLRLAAPAEEKKEIHLREIADRVARVRAKARGRQRCLNGRLPTVEVLTLKPWSAKANLLLRSLATEIGNVTSLARVALTICDLREGEEVEERDLLEARHYSVLSEMEGVFSKSWRKGSGSVNSSAIP